MKLKKNMFLEVSDKRICGIEFSKHKMLSRTINFIEETKYYKDRLNLKDFKVDIKNKNLYILIEGETVYIKMVTLPLVKKHQIHDMIKNELRYYYKDIENMAFTYKSIKEDKINMELLVFCLKGSNLDILENSIENNITLRKINLIQFCFKNYYSNKINANNYILVFYYNSNIYFLMCCNNEIVANNIVNIEELDQLEFAMLMNEFLEQYNDYTKLSEKIYYANIKELNISELEYAALPYQILDEVMREELLKYMIVKG